MGGQHRQRRRDIFVLQKHPVGDPQADGREIPNGAHPALHEHIANLLRAFGGHGDNPDVHAHAPAEVRQLADRQNFRRAADIRRGLVGLPVKGGDQPDAELREPLVPEQRASELPGAHKHRLVDAVIAEEGFDVPHKAGDLEPRFRLARTGTDGGEVLADLDLVKPQRRGELRRGNARVAGGQALEKVEIHGQPQQRLPRYAANAGPDLRHGSAPYQ